VTMGSIIECTKSQLLAYLFVASICLGTFPLSALAEPPVQGWLMGVTNVVYGFTAEEVCTDENVSKVLFENVTGSYVLSQKWPAGRCGGGTYLKDGVRWGAQVQLGGAWLCRDGTLPDVSKALDFQCGGGTPERCPVVASVNTNPACLANVTTIASPSAQTADLSCPVGNPVFPSTGVKVQPELDISGQGPHPLDLVRTYTSAFQVRPRDGFGNLWMHNWQRKIQPPLPNSPNTVALRGDGSTVAFAPGGGGWLAPASVRDRLVAVRVGSALTGWQYVNAATDEVEFYDASGKLLSIKARNGWVTSLSYSDAATPFALAPRAGLLLAVQNQFGVRLDFTYDAQGRIASVATPNGATIRYTYDANWMLTSVTWPDGTVRGYHYEDPRFAGALTGITDEKGIRFATFAYDSLGRAAAEEHANGVDKLQFGYVSNRSQTTVTPSDSIARLFSFEVKNNVVRPTTVSSACPECGNPA
ncbi:DUF6531 domain-containing protein, partial [Cupriavidus pauculus]